MEVRQWILGYNITDGFEHQHPTLFFQDRSLLCTEQKESHSLCDSWVSQRVSNQRDATCYSTSRHPPVIAGWSRCYFQTNPDMPQNPSQKMLWGSHQAAELARKIHFVIGLPYYVMGEGNGNPLRYSCLENPMDRGAWQAMVHRIAKSQTRLKWLSTAHYVMAWIVSLKNSYV